MQPRLDLRLSQRLIMTPQLQQAIKLLQLSRLELQEALTQQLEENPLLEEGSSELEDSETEAGTSDEGQDTGTVKRDEDFDDDRRWGDVEAPRNGRDELPSLDQTMTKTASLEDHLVWQLALAPLDRAEQDIGRSIIGNLDEDGYLRTPLEELVSASGVSLAQATHVLKVIQGFDPVGVAARDLPECLLAQIEHLGLGGSLVEAIIRHHLSDLEHKRYPAIAKALGVPVEAVLHAIKIIEGLEPKPGRPFF